MKSSDSSRRTNMQPPFRPGDLCYISPHPRSLVAEIIGAGSPGDGERVLLKDELILVTSTEGDQIIHMTALRSDGRAMHIRFNESLFPDWICIMARLEHP